MKLHDKLSKKIIELEELEEIYNVSSYDGLYMLVSKLIDEGKLEAIKSSCGNGKKPALYMRYRVLQEEEDKSAYIDELNYKVSSKLDISYYKNDIKKYKIHRDYILALSDFIKKSEKLLEVSLSMNERSFQIWGEEKFLQKGNGKTILKNLGIDTNYLNYYDTSEPLAYYSKSKKIPQNILVIENKDTYYTMRKFLITSNNIILGTEIDTVIYGAGKGVIKAFKDYHISVEEYLSNKENTILYFGDIDYEGIGIYERFYEAYKDKYKIKLFINGYKEMIDKVKNIENLPITKKGQNKNIDNYFLSEFSEVYRKKIQNILEKDVYIPQEIINIIDLSMEGK